MNALEVARVLVVGYVLLACSLVGRAIRAIRRADAHKPSPCHADTDGDWLDDQPAEVLSDAEVERQFARLAGWVQ